MRSTRELRVVVIDDEEMLRLGLKQALPARAGFDVVADTRVCPSAAELAVRRAADIVLLGIDPRNEHAALDLVDRLCASSLSKPIRVVALGNPRTAHWCVMRAILLGVSGFLLRNLTEEELVCYLQAVAEGHSVLSPPFTTQMFNVTKQLTPVGAVHWQSDISDILNDLSARGRDILAGIARGQSNQEIARENHLTVATVKSHVSNILAKLGARDRLQAALMCHHVGLISAADRRPLRRKVH